MLPSLARTSTLLLLAITTLCTHAQTSAVTANTLVDRLIQNAAVYNATLPSLAAKETILSQDTGGLWLLKGSDHVEAEATIRVTRETPDGPLQELRQFTMLNGKPVKPGQHVALPNNLIGGFGAIAELFFDRQRRYCYTYVLAPHDTPDAPYKLSISVRPQAVALPHCPVNREIAQSTATVLVDPATRHLTHLEWYFPAEFAAKYHRWTYVAVDMAPARIGDETFWLPTTVIGRGAVGKNQSDWTAHYSDYHRYTATSTILPTTSTPPPPQ